jgi:hypothetical protein
MEQSIFLENRLDQSLRVVLYMIKSIAGSPAGHNVSAAGQRNGPTIFDTNVLGTPLAPGQYMTLMPALSQYLENQGTRNFALPELAGPMWKFRLTINPLIAPTTGNVIAAVDRRF